LNECKEWHEGYVTQYHRSGKHFVEFRLIGEKRWMNMKKVAFYIVERPHVQNSGSGEFKENDLGPENDGLAPVEVCTRFDYFCGIIILKFANESIEILLTNCLSLQG
jgi:hypothetical protein